MALAHTMLVTIYHMLKHGTEYQDLGGNYYDRRDQYRSVRRAVQRMNAWDTASL